jgi:hypothetical protein
VDGSAILRSGLKMGHDILEQAVDGLTPEQLHHRFENSTIDSIATIYAHMVMWEDWLMTINVAGRALLFERECWAEKVGISMVPFGGDVAGWLASVPNVDFTALRAYADAVYAESDECIAGLTETDLDRTVMFVDEMALGAFLQNIVCWHAMHHGGEVCALKGVLGGKGLPF